MNGGYTLFFKDEVFNPFIGTGANGMTIDDFGIDNIDFGREGFIGGSYISAGQSNGQPIRSMALPAGTPSWAQSGSRPWVNGTGTPCPSVRMGRTWPIVAITSISIRPTRTGTGDP